MTPSFSPASPLGHSTINYSPHGWDGKWEVWNTNQIVFSVYSVTNGVKHLSVHGVKWSGTSFKYHFFSK